MAKVLKGGHVARALEFYDQLVNKEVYFAIGGSKEWTDASSPDPVVESANSLNDIIGLKLPDEFHMVIETSESGENLMTYRGKNYKKITARLQTKTTTDVPLNSNTTTLTVGSNTEFRVSDKIRISWLSQEDTIGKWNVIEATIIKKNDTNNTMEVEFTNPLSLTIPADSDIIGGAIVEGANYVYVECYLQDTDSYTFPKLAYRQIGLCTGVIPAEGHDSDSVLTPGEYVSLGTLEILDNRKAVQRDDDQREKLSLIIEF